MKPGQTHFPAASQVRSLSMTGESPTRVIFPSSTTTSPVKAGAPVPSTTFPSRITRSTILNSLLSEPIRVHRGLLPGAALRSNRPGISHEVCQDLLLQRLIHVGSCRNQTDFPSLNRIPGFQSRGQRRRTGTLDQVPGQFLKFFQENFLGLVHVPAHEPELRTVLMNQCDFAPIAVDRDANDQRH